MIVTLSGRSGVGKTSITQRLLKEVPSVRALMSFTTREPRVSDRSGEYAYLTRKSFDEKTDRGEFLWTKEVDGEQYGTTRKDLAIAAGERHLCFLMCVAFDTVLVLAEACRADRKSEELLSFYIESPDSDEVLRKRMLMRGDSLTSIDRRLEESWDWDMLAHSTGHPFIFIRDTDAMIEEKVEVIMNYIAPYIQKISSLPPP